MGSLQVSTCDTCKEKIPGMTARATPTGTECVRCRRDKNCPKAYSCNNNMHPGPVPQELLVTITGNYYIIAYAEAFVILHAGTDTEWVAQSLPRLPSNLDVLIIRKEGANNTHRDFQVRRQVVHRALQWLVTHNQYYRSMGITIDYTALDQLPQEGNFSDILAVTDNSSWSETTTEDTTSSDDLDDYLPQSFVLTVAPSMTEQEAV